MNSVKTWVHASRPKTLIFIVSPVLIGTAMALTTGSFSLMTFLCTLIAGLSIQIGTNYANDYFDYLKGADTNDRKGPLRVMQAGLVSAIAMKRAIALILALAAVSGSYLIWEGGWIFGALLILSIALSILYTGGPYPLAYLGLGECFVFVFYGPVAVLGTYYLQTQTFSLEALIASIAPGMLAIVPIALNNLRDLEEDKRAEKKTLAVRFGQRFAKYSVATALILGAASPLFLVPFRPFIFLSVLTLFPALALTRDLFKGRGAAEYGMLFKKTPLLIFTFTFLFCVAWML